SLPPCQARSCRRERGGIPLRRLQPQTRLLSLATRFLWCRDVDDGDQLQLSVSRLAGSSLRSFLAGLVCLCQSVWQRPCLRGGFHRGWLFPSFRVVVLLRS